MSRWTLLAALVLLAPLALAQGPLPAQGAATIAVGPDSFVHWVGAEPDFVPRNSTTTARVGEAVVLWFAFEATNASNVTRIAYVNVTSATLALPERSLTMVVLPQASGWGFGNLSATTPQAVGNATYDVSIEWYSQGPNETTLLGTGRYSGLLVVESAPAPLPPEGTPTSWLVWGAAGAVVATGLAAYGLRQRSIRKRMNEGPRRSQVMRELELEDKLGRTKDPEKVQQIQQEIRGQEAGREQRRELQILEAKRADAQKTLDLLLKRHQSGGLTKLQYENMAAKKRADLERIEAEIAGLDDR